MAITKNLTGSLTHESLITSGLTVVGDTAIVMDHTMTVGTNVTGKSTNWGFGDSNNFNYGSMDTLAVPWAVNRNVATINYNTSGGFNIVITNSSGNSGWTSLEFYDGSNLVMTRTRSGMSYTTLTAGGVTSDFWQVASGSANPFGTTIGATRFLKWNY